MKKFNLHSMWIKCFFLIFLLMALPIILMSYTSEKYTNEMMLEQKRLSDLKDLSSLTSTMSLYLDSVENLGQQILSDLSQDYLVPALESPHIQVSDYEKLSHKLENYSANFSSVSHISFMDKNGRFLYENDLNKDRLAWFFNPTYLKRMENATSAWTPTFSIEFASRNEVQRVIAHFVPVRNDRSELLGYLLLYVPTVHLQEMLSPFNDGTLILESERITASKNEVPYYMSIFQMYNVNYGYLLAESSVIVNTNEGALVVTTKNYSRLGFQLVIISSYEDLKQQVMPNVTHTLFIGIYELIFSLLSALILSRYITKPVSKLKKAMDKTNTGDFDTRVKVKGKDEVAELGITFNTLLDTIQNLLKTIKRNYKVKQQIQFQLIQEQVKPHFLYNMLETINSMIRCDLKDESIEVVSNLASFYRISLNNGANVVRISQEIDLMEHYLRLQRLRYIEFMDYTLSFTPDIHDYAIPKLTLQPLIENAIYHGLKEKGSPGILSVSGYLKENMLVFEIFDTGKGISNEKIQEIMDSISQDKEIDNYFGIASVLKRLNIFCGNQAELHIDSVENEYTCVTLTFPAVHDLKGDFYDESISGG
ncbi:MAG: histidine kinase [Eubacteriales bacterium]|nr:histidine kinase [Eubacteriales bacterium]